MGGLGAVGGFGAVFMGAFASSLAHAQAPAGEIASGMATQSMGWAQVKQTEEAQAENAREQRVLAAADADADADKKPKDKAATPVATRSASVEAAEASHGGVAEGAGTAKPDVPKTDLSKPASSEVQASAPVGAPSLSLAPGLEITAGTNGLFSFSDVSTQISVFAELRYGLSSWLQLGASAAYRYQSGSGTEASAFQGLIGPTINFPFDGDIRNAFFASILLGATTGQTMFGNVVINSDIEFTGAVSVGKRFALGDHVAYAPTVGMVKEFSFDPVFTIQPLAFSIFF